MNEEFELLIVLIMIMLWCNWKYPKNYFYQSFWILTISVYGGVVISITNNILFPLTLMIFNIMVNYFHLEYRGK